ncbi:MAG: type II toxin-antitoxin system VapC family toxin [Thermodesulfobacteriota bacterium]
MPVSQQPHIFIDANLIMYSLGGIHPLREPCRRTLEKIREREILVLTNTEVLQEILHRYFSIGRSTLGEMAYQSLVEICVTVLPVTLQDTTRALELLKAYKLITSRDAIHTATMINNGVKEIISTDSHFDSIQEIKRIDPVQFR